MAVNTGPIIRLQNAFALLYIHIHHTFKSQDIIVRIDVITTAPHIIWPVTEHKIQTGQHRLPMIKLQLFHKLPENKNVEQSYRMYRFPHRFHRLNHLRSKLRRFFWFRHVNNVQGLCSFFHFHLLGPRLRPTDHLV